MTIEKPKIEASLSDALIPIVILITLLGGSVYLFEDNSSFGPNQIALLVAMGIAAIIGLKNGYSWDDIEQGIIKGISRSLGAILILLAVGCWLINWYLDVSGYRSNPYLLWLRPVEPFNVLRRQLPYLCHSRHEYW
ncbi:Na+/H+ antiporter NhaC [Paraglaciecola psychrophila 170]|uniref:Na+/H+ antiporter NhaC n=1 Tax=Paraglaciecola psychrophila 170 TaxID=1129794 RepID=M4RNB1_9ALTE|nr:Na+/H+ antiporter NhaC [Paraglaciecola psychrophila 170]